MNPSTAQATVVVDELVRGGVRQVVVCPGSRNAPLSIALHAAAVAGRLSLHVRIDERSAAFFALGIARGSGETVAVVCTSGTAVANLHPAALEAHHARVPLLLVTADRPGELVGTGANQTVRQHGIFGPDVSVVDMPLAERIPGRNPVWRGTVCRALAVAAAGGPVQLNVPLRDPLVPGDAPPWPDSLAGRPDGVPWTVRLRTTTTVTEPVHLPARTVVVLGDGPHAAEAAEFAAEAGWPVIAEPVANGGNPLRHGALLLAAGIAERLRPDAVLAVGRPTLSRGVQRLLGSAPLVHVVDDAPEWTDPQHVASTVAARLAVVAATPDEGWARAWEDAAEQAADVVETVLSQAKWPTGMHVARELVAAAPAGAVLFAGSSNPIRDLDFAAVPRADVHVYANRGVAGIDGSVSSALGIALGTGRPGYALIGDLTFLHDSGGLLIGPGEARPDVTIVVLNDDGGGIFTLLEQGAPEHADSFERVFGTPHGTDLAALCAAHGVPHVLAEDAEVFRTALAPQPGIRVVEVRADRSVLRDLHARLRTEVHDRITG